MPRLISWIATIGRAGGELQAGGERQRPERAMRRDGDVIGLGHRRDLAAFEDSAGVAQVGLDDVDRAAFEERLEVPAREQPLAERDRGAESARRSAAALPDFPTATAPR